MDPLLRVVRLGLDVLLLAPAEVGVLPLLPQEHLDRVFDYHPCHFK